MTFTEIPQNSMLDLVLACAIGLYAVMQMWLGSGIRRARRGQSGVQGFPVVSVIVAARNEEEHIADCLRSLVDSDYPRQSFEIIVVNDGSTDATGAIAGEIAREHPEVRVLNSTPGKDNLRGKTNAVFQGIAAARGEILMFTDADCSVHREWIGRTVGEFTQEIGIVGGYTLLEDDTMFQTIQSLDWMFLFSISSAMAGLGRPITVIGNNLSVRRPAYEATGGYQKIPFSVTEDYALVQAVLHNTSYKVAFPVAAETAVSSKACVSWKQLYRQKQRWSVGGLDMIWPGMAVMGITWLARFAFVAACFWSPGMTILGAGALIALSDFLFLRKPLTEFRRMKNLKWYIPFELYLTIYVLVIPFVALLSREVVWKERKL